MCADERAMAAAFSASNANFFHAANRLLGSFCASCLLNYGPSDEKPDLFLQQTGYGMLLVSFYAVVGIRRKVADCLFDASEVMRGSFYCTVSGHRRGVLLLVSAAASVWREHLTKLMSYLS